ncbi:UNVERIFIED_CONTAM: Retrovirus-related Pol polyprotein from transposon RE2 [Sesamum latifolium]|uniref:Retrovirus-related Pol polyprotein from transposon RE2 n=1 Tax=Sesamum latifolium TaxID=2727402 RepID=A0AAW2WWF6_9LAMI
MTKKPFVGQTAIANDRLDLVHTDVCGPLSIPARGGFFYFITFTDVHSRYDYIYLMRYKSETFGRFKEYRLEVENQTNRKIKALRSDRGVDSSWNTTTQLSGLKEEPNLVGHGSVHDEFYGIAPSFWGYALETAAKLLNIVLSKSVPQMPYEIWHGKPASYKYLRVWGSPAYVKRLVGDKLDSRSSLCREPQLDSTTSFEPTVHTVVFQSSVGSTRESRVPERYGFVGLTSQLDNDPKTYGEAMSDIDSDKWLEAIKSEMDSMGSNQVWTLVDPPKGVRPVGCKWVYKHKLGADGEVTAFKARLVAKGYTQRPGVNFEETYSPVAMASPSDTACHSSMPEGFTVVGEEQKVYRLQRSIYGLKQAFRSWNTRFDEVIRGYDFIKNDCILVYTRRSVGARLRTLCFMSMTSYSL